MFRGDQEVKHRVMIVLFHLHLKQREQSCGKECALTRSGTGVFEAQGVPFLGV